jgi:hypothetical protein
MKIVMVIIEWVGPRWVRKRNSRSMSGRTEAASMRGRLIFTWASFDVLFPKVSEGKVANREHIKRLFLNEKYKTVY